MGTILRISVIIKTLNEEKRIAATIESVVKALDGKDFEIIVADSGSSDRTVEIAIGYPVTVAQIAPPSRPSCGIGPQLGFQHSKGDFLCLLDGDMLLDRDFIDAALAYFDRHPKVAGVAGHVEEMQTASLEYARRVQRNGLENRVGPIDRMNGGGLYRRAAIEEIGYFSDRNLHGYEEFDLGIRLRSAGWELYRLDWRFVQHFGHADNSYRLLVRRWKSKYLYGIGELLRASLGKPYALQVMRELPELKLWGFVYLWWAISVVAILLAPDKAAACIAILASFAAVVSMISVRKGDLAMGLYTVVAWNFHAAALPIGFFAKRLKPEDPIASTILGGTK